MASRCLLHLSKVDEFASWAERELGYFRQPTKGTWEAPRLKRLGSPPLIYHERVSGDHATCPDSSPAERLVRRWIRERR